MLPNRIYINCPDCEQSEAEGIYNHALRASISKSPHQGNCRTVLTIACENGHSWILDIDEDSGGLFLKFVSDGDKAVTLSDENGWCPVLRFEKLIGDLHQETLPGITESIQ